MEQFIEGVWDWGFLRNHLGGSIQVSDLDGIVERHGKFLVLEAKRPGISIPVGQRLMFEAMANTGIFTVIIIWGETNAPVRMEVWDMQGKLLVNPATIESIQEEVQRWYIAACQQTL